MVRAQSSVLCWSAEESCPAATLTPAVPNPAWVRCTASTCGGNTSAGEHSLPHKSFLLSYCQMLLSSSRRPLSHSRCPANQVAVVDEVTALLHCAPSPCGPTTCRNGGTCLAHSTKNYQCRCPEGFRGQWCEIGQVKSLRLAPLSPSSILAISMCLLVFFGSYPNIMEHFSLKAL